MKISLQNIQRVKAMAIFFLPIAILFISTYFFYSGFSPEGRTNNGILLEEPIDIGLLNLKAQEGPLISKVQKKWLVLHMLNEGCKESCWSSLYKARQVNTRLSKDRNRLARYLITTEKTKLSKKDLEKISSEYPKLMIASMASLNLPDIVKELNQDGVYILFDPLGNGLMVYTPDLPGGELLEDLKKLLKNSKIG
tara:strand:- start:832 stop:1416 length:585 start_codon:yes stop_codon:yes gene_type:complete